MQIERLDSTLFDWLAWRAGHPLDLGILRCRYAFIVAKGDVIRRYAVGYCDGGSLPCRPKAGHKAVMFFKDGVEFWFHITNREFEAIFEEAGNGSSQ